MKYRNVGKSGLRVSSYGIAVWQNMSSKIGEEQVESIVQAAYEKVRRLFVKFAQKFKSF